MRFRELDFQAYGPFSGLRLRFPAEVGLQVIYGPNESGKSSALRAVGGLLYGIPGDGRDEFLHPADRLRIRAMLVSAQGVTLTVARRSGKGKKTLLDEQERPLDPDPLPGLLQGVDKELFWRLYGLDHRTLSEGGKALLAEEGKIGEALFAAGLGPGFRKVRERLTQEAEKLWTKASRKREIDQAIDRYGAAHKTAVELTLSGDDWQRLCDQERGEEATIATLEREIRELDRQKQRLRRFSEAHAPLTSRASLQSELAELGGLPELGPDFPQRRQALQAAIASTETQLARLHERQTALRTRLEPLPAATSFLDAAASIDRLQRKLEAALEAEAALPVTRANLESTQRRLRALADDLGLRGDNPEFESLPDAPQRAQVRRLAERHRALVDKGEALGDQLALHQQQWELLQERRSALGRLDDTSELESSLKELRAALGLDAEIANLQGSLASKKAALQNALASLPQWSGELQALVTMEVPDSLQIDEFERRWERLESKLKELCRERDGCQDKGQRMGAELTRLREHEKVRSRAELHESRSSRDQLWKELLELEGNDRSAYVRLERALRDIDELTDQLLDNAARVAEAERLTKELEFTRKQWTELHDRCKRAEAELDASRQAWRELWDAPQLSLAGPAGMRTWLARREALVAQWQEANQLQQRLGEAVERRESELERHRRFWSTAAVEGLGATVSSAIERAERALAPRLEAAQERARLDKEAERLRQAIGETEVLSSRHREQLEAWGQEWSSLAGLFRRSPQSSPSDLESLLERYEELRELRDEAERGQRALHEQTAQSQQFRQEVATLQEQLGEPGDLGGEASALIEGWVERLREQRSAQNLRQELAEQLETANVEVENLEATLQQQQAQWKALLQEAGVDSGLGELEGKVARRQQIVERLRDLEETLRPLAGGGDVNRLASELAEQDLDALPAQIRELERQLQSLEQERDLAWQRRGAIQQKLRSFDGAEAAAEAAQATAEAMAEGKALVTRYARLALAEAVLRRQMERYRQDHEAPLLGHASGWFRRLTTNAYEGLITGNDPRNDAPRLEAVSASGRRVPVEGLSDGTRDQLFLALRLATVELSLDTADPVPMVMDDVLVQFDTERAKATLDVLAEFAQRNQILLFTHLERDRQLALDLGAHRAHVLDLEPVAL